MAAGIVKLAILFLFAIFGVTCKSTGEAGTLTFQQDVAEAEGHNNNFAKCMADCLEDSISDILKWWEECKTDIKCWIKKAGIKALQCVPKCLHAELETFQAPVVEKGPQTPANMDFKCLAECMKMTVQQILKIVETCKFNQTCWFIKVGPAKKDQLFKCGLKCFLQQTVDKLPTTDRSEFQDTKLQDTGDNLVSESDVSGGNFATCMAKCLGKSVPEIEEWIKECGRSKKCWLKKAGKLAVKCLLKCIITENSGISEYKAQWFGLEGTKERKIKIELELN